MSRALYAAPLLLLLTLAACGDDDAGSGPSPERVWACPAGWVAAEGGGCGPAVWLCPGGAAPGACDGVDPQTSTDVTSDGGISGRTIRRLADGSLAGGWPEPEDATGALAPGFAPEVGLPPESCPEGWVADDDGGCDAALREDCPTGTEPLPGGACTDTGVERCPAGDWPEGPVPSGASVLHVLAGAEMGGDGSADAPFATLAEAVVAAPEGAYVLLAEGTYGGVEVTGELHLVGACPARVTVRSDTEAAAALAASGSAASLEIVDVTLTGAGPGLRVSGGARAALRSVVVDRATSRGAEGLGDGSSLELEHVVVRDTQLDADGSNGTGLHVEGGVSLRGRQVAVVANHMRGVHSAVAGTLELSDALVRGTLPHEPGGVPTLGVGLIARGPATMERVVVEDNVGVGIGVTDGGAAELTDVLVRRTGPAPDGPSTGIASFGGTVDGLRVQVDEATQVGVTAVGASSEVRLDRAVIRDTRQVGGRWGMGVLAQEGGQLVLRHARIAGSTDRALYARDAGSVVRLEDVEVRGVHSRPDGTHGFGGVVELGASLDATRLLVTEAVGAGLLMRSADTHASLADAVVASIAPQEATGQGVGLIVQSGATLAASRLRLGDLVSVGLVVSGEDSAATVTDALVADVAAELDGTFGRAAQVDLGGHLSLHRVHVERVPDTAVVSFDPETVLILADSAVSGTPDGNGVNRGVHVGSGVNATIRRVVVRDTVEAGISLYGAATVAELTDVFVDVIVPGDRGLGGGVTAGDGVALRVERAAVRGVAGAGLVSTSTEGGPPGEATIRDLWLESVATGTVSIEPGAPVVAYGLHVGAGRLDVERAVLREGGYGFLASAGVFRLRDAVITGQLDAAGARGPAAEVDLAEYTAEGNADDTIRAMDALPRATALPEPTPVRPGE